ncbi:MAG: Macrolide-specific efflux protein [Candidatus Gottesmanbacteria bacterium GW2011_GWA2_44_17]|uniref:Macrolide-specific efflux protein n=3 Tax=Candidatus Gottesmaniibacteriota TaxID=1752720 RepID=A0A0G1KHB5_9BACT|nr:MAG: Macrolide-specific efflux protein [Microgenomates group bacterium GW2011_GWC1_43_11]KKT37368.1 MAG: Macrolide-specific efflux protein [Candidatus Gottesmanbacteria bacterium GW2011_GWB1_44_11c]KKT47259.1 MAG: Macrolide-specific efflux protein [Candidatus Gottesmanbacteria bacterium GW2011_GWA2_44_17]
MTEIPSVCQEQKTIYYTAMRALFRNKIMWFFLIGIAIGVIVWKFVIIPKQENSNGSSKAKKPLTHTVKRDTIKETLTISGELDAEEKITPRFQSSGLISWIGVKEGDFVKKYQLIATLDQKEQKKNLEKYLNTYLDTRWDFEQEKDEYRQPAQKYWGLTWDQRNEIDRALEQAQFDLNNAVLDVELKDILLKYTTLTSPINGIVTKVAAPVAGVYATATQAEFEVINPDSLYFSLLPDQTEVTKLTSSMSAQIIFDSYPDEKVIGTVQNIAFIPKSGETNTVYEVKIVYPLNDESHTKYRIGMTGDATFTILEKPDVLSIPLSFLKTEKDKKYVTKLTGTKKEKMYVETGIESDTAVEITGGLAEGDVIYD